MLSLCALLGGVFAIVATTQAAVTLPALAGHWAMDEGSGATTADSSGNGNTATLGTGASWSSGPGGAPAIALNGSSAANMTIAKAVVDTSQSFTVSAWVKLTNTAGWQTVVSMDGTSVSGFYLQLNQSSGKFEFIRPTSDNSFASQGQANSGVAPAAGTWYHLVGVDDTAAGQLHIYVNGTEDGTAAYTANWQDSGRTVIGRALSLGQPSNFVDGVVSDVQLYQAALTAAQVDALNGTPVAITAASAGAGSGTAAVSDANPVAACAGAAKCLTYVGDAVTVTPTASPGSRLSGWSGGSCAGAATPCTFTAAKTETDTATFAKEVTISAATSGTGAGTATISDPGVANCSAVASCIADVGDAITITPAASAGSRLTGWSGGSCTGTASPCTFPAPSTPETDTATFAKEVTIATAANPAGTGTGTPTITDTGIANCSAVTSCLADEGDAIVVNANAASGSRLTGWSGGSCSASTDPCKFSAGAGGETDTASFAKEVTIATTTSGTGSGTATISDAGIANCSAVTSCLADEGDAIVITPTAAAGANRFAGWSGGSCTGTSDPCRFTAGATGETDGAAFAKTVTIAAAATPSGKGTATISDADALAGCSAVTSCLADVGDAIRVTASPLSGYQLSSWSGGTCAGKVNPCAFTAAAAETDTAALVAVPTATITATAGPEGTVGITDTNVATNCTDAASCLVPTGDTVTIRATPAPGYSVALWSGGGCSGTAATCVLSAVSADEAVKVAFALTVSGSANSAIFVSPAGSDSNPGTAALPVLTPQHGLALVEASGAVKDQLRLAQGSYSGGLSLTSADDGVAIYGGFDPATWTAELSPATPTEISGAPQAVLADHATSVLIQEVDLVGAAAPAFSESVYGVRAIDGSQLTLSDVAVRAANAIGGARGTAGTPGIAGGAGGAGGGGQTAAQVVASCLASGGSRCTAAQAPGGTAGAGANGNDSFLRADGTYRRNPLLLARARTLAAPGPGPSAGDGGFGGWGSTALPTAIEGCVGAGVFAACGPERVGPAGKRQITALWYGSLGSTPLDAPHVAAEGRGGADGYFNAGGDGYPGKHGDAGSSATAGAAGNNALNP
ncbi:MAG: LamG domain-containing protein, partial [Solirubrobacteraceae bacterium]